MENHEIYVNSSRVSFGKVDGYFVSYDSSLIETLDHFETLESSSKEVVDNDGNQYTILMGCTPAVCYKEMEERKGEPPEEILKEPLVKINPEEKQEYCQGFRSGGRSAILYSKESKTFYRLKGCGNYVNADGFRYPYPGFPIRNMEVFGEIIGQELRGCSFKSPSIRELTICNIIEEEIQKYDEFDESFVPLKIGNSPVGYWVYQLPYQLESSGIPITCTIFKTLGEKRLASHLLAGLDKLLNFGLIHFPSKKIEETLKKRDSDKSQYPICTYQACCTGQERATPYNFSSGSYGICVNSEFRESLESLVEYGFSRKEWEEVFESLVNIDESQYSLIATLYWRIGREIGEFLRFMKEKDIMWGYFFDYNPCEPHCNSHPNNFIVLPPSTVSGNKKQRILAALDFDMAYIRDTFVNPYTKERGDNSLFDEWKQTEITEMERAIGGDIANDGLILESKNTTGDFEIIKYALRDTMLAGCRSAYSLEEDILKDVTCFENEYQTLIKMGLMISNTLQS